MSITENRITQIRKRDGRIADFDKNKIVQAIWRSAQSVGGKDQDLSKNLSEQVMERLNEKFHARSHSNDGKLLSFLLNSYLL